MSIIQIRTNSFITELASGYHAFTSLYRPADSFRMALYTDQAQLDATTTVYSAINEVVGTGYTAGGNGIAFNTPVNTGGTTGGVTYFNPSYNIIWGPPAAFTANGALIYNVSQGNRSVFVLSFGIDITCTTVFTVTFPNNTSTSALIRYQ